MTAPLSSLPHAPGRIPLLGDVTSVDRRRPTQKEAQLAGSLGPIFQRLLLGDRLVLVAGGRLATECSDEVSWARALAGPGAKLRAVAGAGLFTARTSDPLWGQARRILSPGFTQSALRMYHDAMNAVADDLLASWGQGGVVDVHQAMTSATLEVISRAGFSRSMGLFAGDSEVGNEFVAALSRTLSWASESTNDLPIIGPLRAKFQAGQLDKDVSFVRRYVDTVIAERRASNVPAGDDDLLSLMLNTVDPETGAALPDDNVRDQVLTFLVAGHETTAALLEVAVYYLTSNPQNAERIREETMARGGHDYDAVSGMRWTRQFLNECLRMWPPVPGYFRVARHEQSLGGYIIPAGQAVFVLSLAAQLDEEVWGPTATTFDPDRFSQARLRQFPDRFFGPWGTGPRSCIGRAFAMQEAVLLISRVVESFSLEQLPGQAELDMHERGTLRPAPFKLVATRREDGTRT